MQSLSSKVTKNSRASFIRVFIVGFSPVLLYCAWFQIFPVLGRGGGEVIEGDGATVFAILFFTVALLIYMFTLSFDLKLYANSRIRSIVAKVAPLVLLLNITTVCLEQLEFSVVFSFLFAILYISPVDFSPPGFNKSVN